MLSPMEFKQIGLIGNSLKFRKRAMGGGDFAIREWELWESRVVTVVFT